MTNKHHATDQQRRCAHRFADGSRCKARPLQGKDLCFWHDPGRAGDRVTAGRQGGSRGRHRTLSVDVPDFPVSDAASIVKLLSTTIIHTLKGEIDPRVANAVGYLAGVILRAREQGELEDRVKQLEESVVTRHQEGKL